MGNRLAVFQTDQGVTVAFGGQTWFIDKSEPFFNIAMVALEKNDMVPFYVEIAKREGVGEEFRDELERQVEELEGSGRIFDVGSTVQENDGNASEGNQGSEGFSFGEGFIQEDCREDDSEES